MGSLFHNFERGNLAALPESKDCAVQKNKPVEVQSSSKKNLGPFPTYPLGSNLKPIPFTMSQVQSCCSFEVNQSWPMFARLELIWATGSSATNANWKNGGRWRGGPVNGFSASWWESHLVHSKFTGHRGNKYWQRHFDKIIIVVSHLSMGMFL